MSMSILEQIESGEWTAPDSPAGPRLCGTCGRAFIQFDHGSRQATCPRCLDVAQGRPTIIERRHKLHEWRGIRVESLPPRAWREFNAGGRRDESRYKMDVRGSLLGVPWLGRFVLWADWPVAPGDIVTARVMEAVHRLPDSDSTETHEYIVLARSAWPSDACHRALVWWQKGGDGPAGHPLYTAAVQGGDGDSIDYAALVIVDTREFQRPGPPPLSEGVDVSRRVFSPDAEGDDYDWGELLR